MDHILEIDPLDHTGSFSDSESEDTVRESAKDKRARITAKRAQSILSRIGGPVGPLEFVALILEDVTSSQEKLEDDAFVRLYRGYDSTFLDGWNHLLQPYVVSVKSYQDLADYSSGLDNGDFRNRLEKRDMYLSSSRQSFGGHRYVHTLAYQIESIHFANDWKVIGQRPGGKLYKKNFANAVYEKYMGRSLPLSSNPCKDDVRLFKVFKANL